MGGDEGIEGRRENHTSGRLGRGAPVDQVRWLPLSTDVPPSVRPRILFSSASLKKLGKTVSSPASRPRRRPTHLAGAVEGPREAWMPWRRIRLPRHRYRHRLRRARSSRRTRILTTGGSGSSWSWSSSSAWPTPSTSTT